MTSAAEVFVVQLARASRKAKKFVRHLQKSDRDDVLADALLWCWEHRDSYSLTSSMSLDSWFVTAVRHSYDKWLRGEIRNSAEMLDEIPTGDTASASVEALEAMDKLVAALTPEDKTVAQQLLLGKTRAEMMREGLSKHVIDGARARIRQLRRLIPDAHEYNRVIRAFRAPSSDHPDADDDGVSNTHRSWIDHEIEQLEAMPKHGADCPPCWKCKWFEGYLPGPHRRVGMAIQEPEVSAAVAVIEARKQDIAKRVRAGTLRGE